MITPAGRPTKYNPAEHPDVARKIMGEGKTLQELSDLLKINRSTLTDWTLAHPVFAAAIQLGKADAIDRIERALHKRAEGFEHKDTYYPPDTHAIKYYLGNKRSQDWREKTAVEHSGHLTLEELVSESLPKPPEKKPG